MKSKYLLSFTETTADRPVIYDIIRKYDVCINILRAEIAPGMTGTMLAEFDAPEERISEALSYLKMQKVGVALVTDKIMLRSERCICCGNCVSACFSKALSISPPEWKLEFHKENCILCKLCLTACPQKLFSIAPV